jgi:hypothetical protein
MFSNPLSSPMVPFEQLPVLKISSYLNWEDSWSLLSTNKANLHNLSKIYHIIKQCHDQSIYANEKLLRIVYSSNRDYVVNWPEIVESMENDEECGHPEWPCDHDQWFERFPKQIIELKDWREMDEFLEELGELCLDFTGVFEILFSNPNLDRRDGLNILGFGFYDEWAVKLRKTYNLQD